MKTYFVDSFTNQPFKGNPAAVCFAQEKLSDEIMQHVATEIGFSETAFVQLLSTGRYGIRFFTPKKEIPLCGHATLASAKVIFDTTGLNEVVFVNCENVALKTSKVNGKISMQFPVYDTEAIEVPDRMLKALGIEIAVNTGYNKKNNIILIEIAEATRLAELRPDFAALIKSYDGINGVLVTAPSHEPAFDFHYRYFWPWAGTEEDPVTGAVQTFLTKYWATKLNKKKLNAFQSSLRTGVMSTELHQEHVIIYGEAVIILEGAFKL